VYLKPEVHKRILVAVMSASVITGRDIPLVKYKKGIKDVRVRTSVAEYTVLFFSEEKVFVYTQQFSLIDSEQKESLQNYSYQDIASISTEKSKYGTHAFIIKLSSGKALSIPCCDEKAADIQGKVATFMQLVRDKK
jgi:hypothetical protein